MLDVYMLCEEKVGIEIRVVYFQLFQISEFVNNITNRSFNYDVRGQICASRSGRRKY